METLNHLVSTLAQNPWPEISIFILSVISVCVAFKIIVLRDDEEEPVKFRITVPEQCLPEWKGKVLEDPAIKVPSFQHDCSLANKSIRSQDRAPYNATARPMADFSGL